MAFVELNISGVGFVWRKLAGFANPNLNIIKEPDGYTTMQVDAPFKSVVNRFRLNEMFDETRMDGKVCKVNRINNRIVE